MHWVETTFQDLRYALRTLRKSPAFSIAAVCTLALGIGANTAIFSVVSGVLLRPLPFADPGRLVQLNQTVPPDAIGPVPYPDLHEWRSESTSFEAVIAHVNTSRNLEGVDEPELLATVGAERGLFRMLGVDPIAGRTFREDDPLHVAVVSAGFWKRRLGGDRSAIGRKITLDGQSFTVIGVMPDGFQFPYRVSRTDLWIPWEAPPDFRHRRNYRVDSVTARLKPGVSLDRAHTELSVIAKRIEAQHPDTNQGRGVRIRPLAEVVAGQVRNSLLVLLGAVGLVLLVACANVANLLLVRAAVRNREVAIRAALGAGGLRLVRQFLTESLLLAIAGGVLGLAIGKGGASVLLKLAAAVIPGSWEIGFDWRVFAFLLAVCVVAGIGFGLAPAMAAARAGRQNGLIQSGGRGGGPAPARFRDVLVAAEVAMAFLLLAGAGLLLRTFLNLQNTETGLVAENVLTLHLTIAQANRRSPEANARYCYAIAERIQQIPGVRAAGIISLLPLQNWGWSGHFTIAGRPEEAPARQPLAELRYVTPGYFRALGIPIRRGRGFTAADTSGAPLVVLINEALARQHFPNEDPVGRRISRGAIVGVVGDVRHAGLDRAPAPEIYYALAQNFAQLSTTGMTAVVSAHVPPESLVSAVRRAIRDLNPDQAIFNIKTMRRVIADSLSDLRLYVWLIGLFAGLALLLAAAGIYGVISYGVASRTREFGIRLALGADAGGVIGLVLRHGGMLVGAGLIAGCCGALALTRLLKSRLFGVTPTDPATLAAMAALLAAVALAACWIPARRAARVDPAIALKYE